GAPKFRGEWLSGVRKDSLRLDEFVPHAASKAQAIDRILPQRMGKREILSHHLKVRRLFQDGYLGEPSDRVADGIHGGNAATESTHSSPSTKSHHVVGLSKLVALPLGIGA